MVNLSGRIGPAFISQNLFGTLYEQTDILGLIRNRHLVKLPYFHRLRSGCKKCGRRQEGSSPSTRIE
jgi:hypothetical protein